MSGWKEYGTHNYHDKRPVPKKLFLRWFNYRQQKFYEATVNLPDKTEQILKQLKKTKPEHGFLGIVAGVKGDGEAVVWATNGSSAKYNTWIEVARQMGREVPGDADNYEPHIKYMRERGEIP